MKTWKGFEKAQIRDMSITDGKIYRNIIDLPGKPCKSVQHLFDNQAINKNTRLTGIERKRPFVPHIKKRLSKFGFNNDPFIHMGELHTCPLESGYDWVNLDTCSSLRPKTLDWIQMLDFAKDGEFNVWLTCYRGNRKFFEGLKDTFLRKPTGISVVRQISRDFEDVFDGCEPIRIATAAALLTTMSEKWEFVLHPPVSYSDHVNVMYFYRFTSIRPLSGKSPYPSFRDVFQECEDFTSLNWRGRQKHVLSESDSIPEICILVASQDMGTGAKAYVTKRIRSVLKHAGEKDPKWIKAGWKSAISRKIKDDAVKKRCFELIDNG
jgi:hypothetical protein